MDSKFLYNLMNALVDANPDPQKYLLDFKTKRLGLLLRTPDFLKGYAAGIDPRTPFSWALQDTDDARMDLTPGAKLSQNLDDDAPDRDLWLNYVPTEFDIGLAWRAKLKRVIYPVLTDSDTRVIGATEDLDPDTLGVVLLDPDESLYGKVASVTFSGPMVVYDGQVTSAINVAANKDPKERVSLKTAAEAKGVTAPDLSLPVLARTPPDTSLVNYNDTLDASLSGPQQGLLKDRCDSLFMLTAYALVGGAWQAKVPKEARSLEAPRPFGNNIGGILVDDRNGAQTMLAWGLNFKGLNPTFHGETLLIQEYLDSANATKLPDGASFYTSLEPCYMCSGYITTVGKNIRVVSGQDDPNISSADKRPSALRAGRNGCSLINWQKSSSYPVAGFLESMLEVAVSEAEKAPEDKTAQRNIIDFLFGEGAEATYFDELSVLTLFIQRKMELFWDEAVDHYAGAVGALLPMDVRVKFTPDSLAEKLSPRGGGVAKQVYTGLTYCNEFLDKLAARGILRPFDKTYDKLIATGKDDPIWKQIPFI